MDPIKQSQEPIKISATRTAHQVRIQIPVCENGQCTVKSYSLDQFNGSSIKSSTDNGFVLGDDGKKPIAQSFLGRFQDRATSIELGAAKHVDVEVSYLSEGPDILTTRKDPTIFDKQDEQFAPMLPHLAVNEESDSVLAQSQITTGTVIRPSKQLAIRAGIITSVDPDKLETDSQQAIGASQIVRALVPGGYASASYSVGPFVGNAMFDAPMISNNRYKYRVGFGVAVAPKDHEFRYALSYSRTQKDKGIDRVKAGVEYHPSRHVTFGVNVSTSIDSVITQGKVTSQNITQGVAAGAYCHIKWD